MDDPHSAPLWGGHPTARGEARAADAAAVRVAATERGVAIPDACIAGVVANLSLLGRHAAALDATGS